MTNKNLRLPLFLSPNGRKLWGRGRYLGTRRGLWTSRDGWFCGWQPTRPSGSMLRNPGPCVKGDIPLQQEVERWPPWGEPEGPRSIGDCSPANRDQMDPVTVAARQAPGRAVASPEVTQGLSAPNHHSPGSAHGTLKLTGLAPGYIPHDLLSSGPRPGNWAHVAPAGMRSPRHRSRALMPGTGCLPWPQPQPLRQ